MKPRSHKNTPRLTAKERARKLNVALGLHWADFSIIERVLQAHAREAVDRYKRRHG